MDISFDQLKWAVTLVKSRGNAFGAYVVENTFPGGHVEFESLFEEPSIPVGKTTYWTNTSGATSSRRYLGHFSVNVVGIPQWIYEVAA